jgi:hypothetical protein
MDRSYLAQALKRPEVVKNIIGSYKGRFSLGVTGSQDEPAILLRVEDEHPSELPNHIMVGGEKVRIIVKGGFRRPYFLQRAAV